MKLEIQSITSLAELGNAAAQHQLAQAYFVGSVISQDYEKSLLWFKKATELENNY